MIQAVIFDMDGLLIDSEPLWYRSELAVFRGVGVPIELADCLRTTGLRIDEVVEYWYQRHPWQGPSRAEVVAQIIDRVVALIASQGVAKPGIDHALRFFLDRNVPVALASSSTYRIIQTVLERLELADAFRLIYSAEEEPYGKPHPGVYLSTARKLEVHPTHCLALEDSLNGVLAAKAARMACIAIPDPYEGHSPKFAIADAILPSLDKLEPDLWARLNLPESR